MRPRFREEELSTPMFFFLDFFLHIFGRRIAINCLSHVSPSSS